MSTSYKRLKSEKARQREKEYQIQYHRQYHRQYSKTETFLRSKEAYLSQVKATCPYERYSEAEVNLIVEKNFPDKVIAERLGRTIEAIQIKRTKVLALQKSINLVE